jgi:TP901-1 family phage major tail protein
MLDLQLFAEAVSGKKIIYLFRVLSDAATKDGTTIAFTTENSFTISKDADTTATKDGTIRTPGEAEIEISATAILSKGDTQYKRLQQAMLNDEIIEIWKVNLAEPVEGGNNKFAGTYYQGYLTEFEETASAEEHVECSTTFGINGTGADGDVTVSVEQQEIAAYVFADTQKTGA